MQILSNLLHNAGKFTAAGGHIAVSGSVEDRDGGRTLTLTVSDSGAGILAEMLPHVFELFVQGRDETRGTAGLGIGLALARELTEMHGGVIEADSRGPGQGSAFTIGMPVIGEASPPLPDPTESATTISLRALIIDDNTDAAETLAALVKALGGESATATDGETGLRTAAAFRPDAILLAISLPGMDGYETCCRLRTDPCGQHAYIVALTGWGQEHDRARARDSGFDADLTKPADPRALESLLARIDGRAAQPLSGPFGAL